MENSVKNSLAVKPIYIQLGFLLLAFLALYYPFIQTLVRDWGTNDNYNHGYFIPIVSAFMIWSLREELAAIEIKPSNWGIGLVVLGLLQLFIAKVGSEYFLQRTSMIVVLFGISFYLFGGRLTRTVQLPLVYLIFMIPLHHFTFMVQKTDIDPKKVVIKHVVSKISHACCSPTPVHGRPLGNR